MGVGKSTIGRILAAELQVPFYDTDRVIEERTGADIPWIFDVEGESGFRDRESAILAELARGEPAVIATGGGIVLRPDNAISMHRDGRVCYLTAPLEQLFARTAKDKKRPLLQVADPRRKLREILAERDPLYRAAADFVINTERRTPRATARAIIEQIDPPQSGPS